LTGAGKDLNSGYLHKLGWFLKVPCVVNGFWYYITRLLQNFSFAACRAKNRKNLCESNRLLQQALTSAKKYFSGLAVVIQAELF
jgi:hypothetical protein